ncbi:hypothetical protein AM500_08950 [Bacillus sp. FJAT-18017]|nr:hypothetical protein AM500_08950 [Bacillus sp. FJAT-18017]
MSRENLTLAFIWTRFLCYLCILGQLTSGTDKLLHYFLKNPLWKWIVKVKHMKKREGLNQGRGQITIWKKPKALA